MSERKREGEREGKGKRGREKERGKERERERKREREGERERERVREGNPSTVKNKHITFRGYLRHIINGSKSLQAERFVESFQFVDIEMSFWVLVWLHLAGLNTPANGALFVPGCLYYKGRAWIGSSQL